MIESIFDAHNWAQVPFHFWSVVFFVLGCIIGSFLNVCIHRMPAGESIVSPPSHCPHCRYSIPWYLNIPLVTWVYLGGKCRNCGAPISFRYFLVELLTGVEFLACWLAFGRYSPGVALIAGILIAGLIVSTFIDFEHFIIPDEITIGGMAAGLVFSLLVPKLQGQASRMGAMKMSLLGMAVGAGVVYAILRLGKLLFGRQRIPLPAGSRVVFTETAVHVGDKEIPFGDIFYRKSDTIVLQARKVELVDRCYKDALIQLSPSKLKIGAEELDPEAVLYLEAEGDEIVVPREARGLGDVKFMAAIGAFLGWPAVLFSLMVSSIIGAVVGVALIALRKREWSSRLPYGPYIAMAAVIWIFFGAQLVLWWKRRCLGM